MDNYMDLDLETPFQPLSPVKVENFKGRVDIIKKNPKVHEQITQM